MKPILILISLLLNNLIYSNIYCIDHSVNTVINTLTPKKTNLKAYNNTPFRYQGQYEDVETGLYYNRFRYYSPDSGTYISKDPIGLLGNNPNLYAYVHDVNSWVDPFGLAGNPILFCSKFWKSVGGISSKTFLRVKGADVFEIKGKPKLDGLKKGDLFHLDTLHLDEIEVYNKSKMHKGVYDLDGNKIGEAIKGRTCK
ncbi:RHS repeat-associated core domain-containing protein [Tenacibaculum maritimum]|uniref:RHS repeat-associated core domain-containing protein n=1 Tax=Tenacibaculum maritimum TaxID=107401 RepID=UPI0021D1BA98|nr:RHS repeat-associated core domain-containing protein [Tenacibaculum maritimum]